MHGVMGESSSKKPRAYMYITIVQSEETRTTMTKRTSTLPHQHARSLRLFGHLL